MLSFEMPDFYVPWPARLNPNLDAARMQSKAWALEMGILGEHDNSHQVWHERDFDKHDYALLCAYIHPEAPSLELNLMTDWNVWAFYVDDYFLQAYKKSKDRTGAKQYLDRVLLFMPIDTDQLPIPNNTTERALADLWLRTAPTKSQAWRARIIESTRNLLEAFLWELDNISQQRLANPIEYIEMRRQVGAALWSADLVEHAMFVEVPERIATTRPMQVLKNTFADAVHLRNDIFSYQREVIKQGELTNAVLVIERFLEIDTQHAVNLVNDLLTSRLQQFEHTVITELAPLFEAYQLDSSEQIHVINYIRGLQDWQSGAHQWHIQTSRYLNPSMKQTSPINGIFSGLGTSAMRISVDALGLKRLKSYTYVPNQIVGPIQLPQFYMPFASWVNPNLDVARRNSKIWASQMGMLDKLSNHPTNLFIWDNHSFDAADVAFFCALFHPDAAITKLDLDTCWMVWGTYTDDYFMLLYEQTRDMAGAKIFYARLVEFMPIDLASPALAPLTPVERGLADLWIRTASTISVDKRPLFRNLIENLIGGFLSKLFNLVQNHIPDPIDYIEVRRKTSGSEFIMVLPRLVTYEKYVPPEVYRTLTMKELSNAVMDYTGLINDIFSYQKEIEFEGTLNNGVLVIQNFIGCDHIEAIEIVNKLMTARVKQFEHIIASELPVLFDSFELDIQARDQLLDYIKEFKRFMYATLQWHIKVGRYKDVGFHHSSKIFTDGPTGLGTTSARIQSLFCDGTSTDVIIQPGLPTLLQTKRADVEASKTVKTFAVSHLEPSFIKKKEEAQLD